MDPLQSKYPGWSPYVYTLNSPLKYIDPNGKDAVPVVFEDFLVEGKYPSIGHAGVLLINNKSGFTRYFEYGRYDVENLGLVNTYAVPNVEMDSKTGMPTAESLAKVLDRISTVSGKKGDATAAYIKNDNYDAMVQYAQDLKGQNSNKDRKPYSVWFNNCMHFVKAVLEAGGVKTPWLLDPRPNSYIHELRDRFKQFQYDAAKKTTLNYDVSQN